MTLKKAQWLSIAGLFCLVLPISASVIDAPRNNVVSNQCMSEACAEERLETVSRIVRYRNDKVNPCENFYQFACGRYKKTDKSNDYSHLIALKHDFIEKLIKKGISSDFKPYKLIDNIYKTCMNREQMGQQALQLMAGIIKNLGNWPILDPNWSEEDFDWIEFSSNAKKAGYDINYFLDWVPQRLTRDNQRILRYSVRMARSYFDYAMEAKTIIKREMYADYMLKIAGQLGADIGNVIQELNEAFLFENKLYDIISGNKWSKTDDISLEDLKKQWPSIDWSRFIDKTLIPFVDTNEDPIFTVWNATSLTEFALLMEKTPKRVQANYAVWKLIQSSVPYLPEEFRRTRKMFLKLVGYPEEPLSSECAQIVMTNVKYAVINLYLDHYQSSQGTIENMVTALSNQMIRMIRESDLDDEAKREGIKAITEMSVVFGTSEKLSISKELKRFYADALVVKNNFLQTLLNLNVFRMKKDYSNKVFSEVIQHEFNSHDLALPEYFDGRLYIQVSMIPSPLFNNDRPMYMNFGAGGSYMAMAIAEAIVDLGQNSSGKLREQAECFSHLYDDLDRTKVTNDSEDEVLRNMITQYIGLRAAWATYQSWVAKYGTEPALEGIPYSQEQLFWISFAQSFCSEYKKSNDPLDGGSFGQGVVDYKMMKILANIPEISADFQCPYGSRLNPVKRCSWL
ncbi:GSCOCG00013441001-RA-CDS [Cotesia congregata]|nr:GSCOCG00013441001-RA-CDS [Cotesia congregata]